MKPTATPSPTTAPAAGSGTNGLPCGTYPPTGQGYQLTSGPHNATVRRGAIIHLRGHLFRNGANCVRAHLGLWTRTDLQTRYAPTFKVAITGADGQGSFPVRFLKKVRYFIEYDYDAHTAYRGYGSTIFVR